MASKRLLPDQWTNQRRLPKPENTHSKTKWALGDECGSGGSGVNEPWLKENSLGTAGANGAVSDVSVDCELCREEQFTAVRVLRSRDELCKDERR
ncbi:hypothetical protein F2P81_013016 [Scophthalmus maximus]|uniref:Uncharacterized protein n=1 Tax=Scophthalmus maximus TaxID=52904 RepID=A0A6A4SSW2_SCOMX|nr:hypothetical protein F2P81_013016 [Scophthalmus maximus]